MTSTGTNRTTILLTTLLILVLTSGAALAASLSISLTQTGLEPGEALLLGAVGAAFQLDSDVLLSLDKRAGTVEGAVSIAYTAGESDVDTTRILKERESGKEWDAIAQSHGLPPGLQKKWQGHPGLKQHLAKRHGGAVVPADPFEVSVTIRFLSHYYNVREEVVATWIEAGLTLEDTALVLNLASLRGVEPTEVIRLRLDGESWQHLATRYHTTLNELAQPVPMHGQAGGPPSGKGSHSGNAHGKGKGKH